MDKKTREANRQVCKSLNNSANDIALTFIHRYFWDEEANDFQGDLYWVENREDELHYNLFINDYYFSLDSIYSALWLNVSRDELFEWYDHVQRSYMEGSTHHNLRSRYSLRHQRTNV